MGVVGILVICVTSSLRLYFLLALIWILHKLCWTPIRMQFLMGSQGIKGPSYRSFYGSTKEISNMRKEVISRPMDLSNNILSKAQPYIHSWVNKYGQNKLCKLVVELGFCVVFLCLIKLLNYALKFAYKLGFQNVILKGDSLGLIQALKAEDHKLSPLGLLVEDVKLFANNFVRLSYSHIKRSGNSVAHNLAKHAIRIPYFQV